MCGIQQKKTVNNYAFPKDVKKDDFKKIKNTYLIIFTLNCSLKKGFFYLKNPLFKRSLG